MTYEPLLYHYTNSTGLAGILQRKQLWLTDVLFLNDREELVYGVPAMVRLLDERIAWFASRSGPDNPEDEMPERKSILVGVREYLTSKSFASDPVHYVYATSLCEDGDLLSQWRGYGGGTGGFAIGFDREGLRSVTPAEGDGGKAALVQVAYGGIEADVILNAVVGEMAPRATGHPGVQADYESGLAVTALTVVKNPGFSEEREHRLIAHSNTQPADLKFRPGGHGLVPYRIFTVPSDAIRRIVIGPNSDPRVAASTRQLVRATCGENVEVAESTIPYR